jgi:hypothetical protein
VLTGVLLHVVEARRPVEPAVDGADGQRGREDVEDLPFEVKDLEDLDAAIVPLSQGWPPDSG